MADISTLIRHIFRWECSVIARPGESMEHAYGRAAAKGVTHVKHDSGGATLCGVTLRTYTEYRRMRGQTVPTESDLARLGYSEWLDLLKRMFWNPCKADSIQNDRIALMLVDWRWVNGPQAVRDMQTAFSLVSDGIVGPKTLAALNALPHETVFERLKQARIRSYHKIVARRPSQQCFLKGWLNRTEGI